MQSARGDDAPKWPLAAIPCFVVLTVLFGWPFAYFAPTARTDALTGLITPAYMWTPGAAAIATCWIFRRRVAAMPWGMPAARYGWLGYSIPVGYALSAYVFLWSTGLAPSKLATFDASAQAALGLGSGTATVVAAAMVATVGVIRACANALGEEIGWRGFLVPALAERMSFWGVALVSGLIWFAWHIPSILLTNYNAGAPIPFTLTCFGIGVLAAGGIAAWLSLRSNSLWPAVLFHASHNAWTQLLLDRMTVEDAQTAYWATEFGIGLTAATVLAFVLLCWLGGIPKTPEPAAADSKLSR